MADLDTILGEVKPIDRGTSAQELGDLLGKHRAALQHIDRESAEGIQATHRMIQDTERKLSAAIEESKAVWEAHGDASDVDRRFFDDTTGAPQLGERTELRYLPNGQRIEIKRDGLLTAPAGTSPEHEALIRAYQNLAVASRLRSLNRTAPTWGDKLISRQYALFVEAAERMGGKTGAWFKRIFSDPNEFKRAISNTSGSGGELVSVPTIAAIRRPTDLARRIPGLIATRPAPAPSFKPPIVTGRALSKKRSTVSNDPSRYPQSNFTTSDTTVTVVDRTIMANLDMLWATDNGLVLADPMGFVMDWLMMGDADTLEMAFLHGDTAGTHQDTLSTWTMGGLYSAGALEGSESMLTAWIGFRARAHDDNKIVSAGGSFSSADHFAAMEALGVRAGGNVAMLTGLHALYTQLLPSSEFVTVDKFGARATLVTGELGSIGGVPVIISQMLPAQFDSSSGLYTGSNSSSIAVYVDRSAYAHYEHASGQDDFDISYPERGAQYVGMVRRSVLTPEVISTENPAVVLYNL